MALTPADVHNVVFNRPPIGQRGYDENEVDQFLDLIEDTLTDLQDENNALQSQVANGATSDSGVSSEVIQNYETQIENLKKELATAKSDFDAEKSKPAGRDVSTQSARILALAQETADRLTEEAQSEATAVKNAAQSEADQLVNDSTAQKSKIIADATSTAEATVHDAQERAKALQDDAERKHNDIMTSVHKQQAVLEGRIAKLQTYEREYRTRMKTFLESQLEELASRDESVTDA